MSSVTLTTRLAASLRTASKRLENNAPALSRYERGEARPFVEMAAKLAKAIEVSLDYLAGKTDMEIDNTTLRRMQEVAKMSEKDKDYVFTLLDAFIARTKLQGLV